MGPLLLPGPLALAILFLAAVSPLVFAFHINPDNSAQAYFPPQGAAVVLERQLRERFPQDELLIAAFAGEQILDDDFLMRLDQVVEAMERHPLVERVLAPSTVDHIRGTEDDFIVEPLLDRSTRSNLDPAQRSARLTADRFAPGLLVADDGSLLAIAVRPYALESSLDRLSVHNAFLEEIRDAGIDSHLVAVSGQLTMDVAQFLASVRDSLVFVPATLAIGLGLIAWLFRRWLALVAALAVIMSAVGSALAYLVVAGQPMTLITAILPPLLVAMSIALLVHWYNALVWASRVGATGRARVIAAWNAIHRPALFTALTTAAGLVSLSLSPIPPIRALGQAAAFGVLVLYVLVIWILPPIFDSWDKGDWRRRRQGVALLDSPVARLRSLGMRHPLWVLLATGVLLVVGVPQVSQVQVETDLFRYFKETHPISQSNVLLTERLSGVTTLDVVFEGPSRDAFLELPRLEQVAAFRDWVLQQPEVDRATSMADMIEEMHWAFHAEDPAYRILPDSEPLVAQYLFIYDGTDLYELVDRDFRLTRVLVSLNVNGSGEINRVIHRIEQYLARADLEDTVVKIAGFGRLFADLERLLIRGQVWGLIAAVLMIFLILAALWRSFAASALCMVPNLAPIIMIFVVMGALGIWLDMAAAMIAAVAIGIAVDDTIHVYQGYHRRRAAGTSHVWALARTYQHAGRAVVATTIILAAQFSILAASQFVPTIKFGILTALGLLAALVFDLLVLPALLTVIARYKTRRLSSAR